MATLHLSRPRDGFGTLRRLRVEVDGREVAALKQGCTVAVSVPAGTHTVTGRMDWTSSPAMDVAFGEDDEARIEVAMPLSALWNMLLRPGGAVTIRRR